MRPAIAVNPVPAPALIPCWSIALLSAAALAFEVLLTRLFAIIQWHHFSYMIISLALLGYGASGAFLTLLGERAQARFRELFVINAALFATLAVTSFLLAQRVPFNPLEIGWDSRQLGYLAVLYLLLAAPFFCAANCIGLAFMGGGGQIHRIYAFDLTGAGVGALGIILLLTVAPPDAALLAVGALGLAAAGAAALEVRWRPYPVIAVLLAAGLLGALASVHWTSLRLSEYKALSQALQIVGAERAAERSSPLGLVTVVRNDQTPFRYAPGLSLAAQLEPPRQQGLFIDGDEAGVITRFTGELAPLTYLDYLTSALPYHLLAQPHVLVLGAGGGADVLQALYHHARQVDAVELNAQVAALMRGEFADFAGQIYDRSDVRLHTAEARGFVTGSADRYDLIQVALLDAFNTAAAGLYALSESYLYTVEAFEQYLRHLNPGGLLAVTRWLRLPPRDSLKLFATAAAALERQGVTDPGSQLALIRGWKTSTLVVKNGPFTAAEIARLQTFCQARFFDVAWYPGMKAAEANRFNLLDQPYLYEGAVAILGPDREDFFQRYKFDVTPSTDDRPYFFRFFKWRTLPELLALEAGSGLGQLEWGYLVLVATLLQALLAGSLLILLPLWLGRTQRGLGEGNSRWRVLAYFTAIGLGFLFLEIAFIQKFILFLSHPLYAVSVVLCAFLVFAGLGSRFSRRLTAQRSGLNWAVAGVTGMAGLYLWALPWVFPWALPWPEQVKILLTVMLIAPLAFCMGIPFPLGLARVSAATPGWVPWAWAINGCASVVSAVLATLLAVQIGFSGVVAAAVVVYLAAVVSAPHRETPV